eukprot:SAG22_NODE_4986_length_1115_cov_1.403543_1_plen_33_part_10
MLERVKRHDDWITKLHHLPTLGCLLSSSKDNTL